MKYVFLILNVFGAGISGLTFGYYLRIWKSLRNTGSFLLLFLPAITMMMSVYRIVSWYLEYAAGIRSYDIPSMLLWHIVQVVIILVACVFQLLVLVWSPRWFRRVHHVDRKEK